jgi:hypothetical protein
VGAKHSVTVKIERCSPLLERQLKPLILGHSNLLKSFVSVRIIYDSIASFGPSNHPQVCMVVYRMHGSFYGM